MDIEQSTFVEKIYREMFKQMYVYSYNILGKPGLAEEAVQEAFIVACSKADYLMNSESPKGWIINTLKNVIRNMQRKMENLNKLVIDSLPLEDYIIGVGKNDDYTDVEYSDMISSEEYLLLKKVALQKYSMMEAATELGISVEASKKRVQRAKSKLREIIENN